jgi:xylan 1,4-beta-xylosidase
MTSTGMEARARWTFWMLAAGLIAPACPARAQTPELVNISVDATAPGGPLERVWPFHGYDEINYTTLPEGQALLATLAAAHTAPVHVRSHFLLNTGDGTPAMKWGSTNVYTEDAAGNPIYDWTLTDGIMDTITSVGAFPFVELGFMPEALSAHPTPYRNAGTTTLDGGCFYPPADHGKWANLISAWAAHANGRYPKVATSWLWELWNEPDIGYWHGTFADYAKLYDYTEAALHQAIPNAALGGPAVARPDGDFLSQFLDHCATGSNAVTGAIGTRLDLVSFHAKGGVAINDDHVEMNLGNQLRLHRAGFDAVAAYPQFKRTPIYITEADPDGCAACPLGFWPEYAYRNSTAYGAYELAMMKHSIDLAAQVGVRLNGVLTWAFTFPGTPYFPGYRALATNGIDMPVLGAFKLLGRLAGARLPLVSSGARPLDDILTNGVRGQPDLDGMATLDGDAVQVLVWNYHDDIVSVAATPVHLTLKAPTSFGSSAQVSHLRVDDVHGDAYTVWVSQGTPEIPSPTQVEALKQAMDPSPLPPYGTLAVAADGSVNLEFDLPRFGISLITIRSAADPTAGGAGIDGGVPAPVVGREAGGGCSCGIAGHGDHATGSTSLLALGVLAFVLAARRRSARCGRRGREHGARASRCN